MTNSAAIEWLEEQPIKYIQIVGDWDLYRSYAYGVFHTELFTVKYDSEEHRYDKLCGSCQRDREAGKLIVVDYEDHT